MPLARKDRSLENRLLVMAGIYALIGGILVLLVSAGNYGWLAFLSCAVTPVGFWAVSLVWRRLEFRPDQIIMPLAAVLTATSICLLYRLEPFYGIRQVAWLAAGLVALVFTTVLFNNYHIVSRYKFYLAGLGLAALSLPLLFGIEVGGARGWLDFGLFYLQPSEFVKIMLVMFWAAHFASNHSTGVEKWAPPLVTCGAAIVLLLWQKDLGMSIVYGAALLSMVFTITGKARHLLAGLSLMLAGTALACQVFPHVQTRMEIWFNPWQEELVTGAAYQVVQSLLAIKAGGMFGTGLGAGRPDLIPAVHNDFIFAAICEEMGLIGGAGIIILLMFLVFRGFTIAFRSRDNFLKLLAVGLTSMISLQALIILNGVMKVLPLTGITLPFVSYGGSSLVANFILLGLLLNISHHSGDFY